MSKHFVCESSNACKTAQVNVVYWCMGLFVAGADCSECREADCVFLMAFCVLGMCFAYNDFNCVVAICAVLLPCLISNCLFPRCGLCHCFLERLNAVVKYPIYY